jgi:hypothetical protein
MALDRSVWSPVGGGAGGIIFGGVTVDVVLRTGEGEDPLSVPFTA